jgi:hypothetical protein
MNLQWLKQFYESQDIVDHAKIPWKDKGLSKKYVKLVISFKLITSI